jgi:hypothetical protein
MGTKQAASGSFALPEEIMGQLELQDGFAPYFDPAKEIEVKTVGDNHPRAKFGMKPPAPPPIMRKRKVADTTRVESPSSRQMT